MEEYCYEGVCTPYLDQDDAPYDNIIVGGNDDAFFGWNDDDGVPIAKKAAMRLAVSVVGTDRAKQAAPLAALALAGGAVALVVAAAVSVRTRTRRAMYSQVETAQAEVA
jgi:hypothetical protein